MGFRLAGQRFADVVTKAITTFPPGAITGFSVNRTNEDAGAVAIGAPVYASSAGKFTRAQATTAAKARVLGLVVAAAGIAVGVAGDIQTHGVVTLTTAQWDVITGGAGGLVAGTDYFLDDAAAGKLAAAAPSTSGHFDALVGFALSTTELELRIQPALELA